MNDKEIEELVKRETARAFREDSEKYREWLQKSARIVAFLFGVVTTVVLGGGAFVFGTSLSDIRSSAQRQVDDSMKLVQAEVEERIIDYRVTAALQERVDIKVEQSVEQRVNSERTQKQIDDRIAGRVDEALKLRLDDAIEMATAKAKASLTAMGSAGFEDAILRAVPVGTIVAWPGKTVPDKWALCDGSSFNSDAASKRGWDLARLRDALGKPGENPYGDDQLPDYQGKFLRGAGGLGAPVGGKQEYATALPRIPFKTDEQGGLSPESNGCDRLVKFDKKWTIKGGCTDDTVDRTEEPNLLHTGKLAIPPHTHQIVGGGDDETRPENRSVNWIIKVK